MGSKILNRNNGYVTFHLKATCIFNTFAFRKLKFGNSISKIWLFQLENMSAIFILTNS